MASAKIDSENENWTQIISSEVGLFDFNWKEVWQYRDLLILFVRRDFVAKYKQTVLGPVWHFIQPLLTTIVSFLLFNMVANISTNGMNPILFQMSGIVIWSYFSTSITSCSNVFLTNASIFGKVYFPRIIMPLSIVISTVIQFAIQFFLILIAIAYFWFKGGDSYIGISWLMLPIYLIIMAILGLALGIIISSITTKYRDMSVLLTFGVQLLMYASAVNYPLNVLQERKPSLYQLLSWNPLANLVDGFRNSLLAGEVDFQKLLYPSVFCIIALFLGILLFNKVEKSFMDTV